MDPPALLHVIAPEDQNPYALFGNIEASAHRHAENRRMKGAGLALPRFATNHRAEIGSFARSFFDALFQSAAAPALLVFDASAAVSGPLLEETLRSAALALPAESKVIVIAGRPPPCALADLWARGSLSTLSEEAFERSAPRATLGLATNTKTEPEEQQISAFRVLAADIRELALRAPDLPQLEESVKHGLGALATVSGRDHRTELASSLLLHAVLVGGSFALRTLRKALEAQPIDTAPLGILSYLTSALEHLFAGRVSSCRDAVEAGLRFSWACCLPRFETALRSVSLASALSVGDLESARATLNDLRADSLLGDRLATFGVQFGTAWERLLSGALTEARHHFDGACRWSEAHGFMVAEGLCRGALSTVAVERRELESALAELRDFRALQQRIRSGCLGAYAIWVEAHAVMHLPAPSTHAASALTELASALSVYRTEERGLLVAPLKRESLAGLLETALEAGLAVDTAQGLVKAHQLTASRSSLSVEHWPWPVRIITLDSFSVWTAGEPLRFANKAQRRPLDLLKVLVALGGRNVPEARVADALWPDTEADAGVHALGITLHRLRRLLNSDSAIERRGHTLTLSPAEVWVDAWAFEHQLGLSQKVSGDAKVAALDRALERYIGPFLSDEPEGWSTPLRERLRAKFIVRLSELCDCYEEAGLPDRAEDLCIRGLDAEPLAERLYLRLMTSYARRGLDSEVIAVYRRCQRTLLALTGTPPSANTEAMYRTLLAQTRVRRPHASACTPGEFSEAPSP
jgi:DNA-binding SARP family transcriptional activator